MLDTFTSLTHAEQYAAAQGIRLTATDRDAIHKAQHAERRRLTDIADPSSKPTHLERFNQLYPRFLQTLLGIGEVLLTLTQTLIIAFGIPIILFLLLVVEQQRVVHGIRLFETDPALAHFAAWALVALNLTLEFVIEYIHTLSGESQSHQSTYRFSWRLWRDRWRYWLGQGGDWQPEKVGPAYRYHQLLHLVTATILSLALAGSMRIIIEQTDGAWYAAVWHILIQSSLLQIFTWLGGLLFAAAAVFSAQGLSRYVALRCVEILAHMQSKESKTEDQHATALEAVAIQYVLAKVAARQQSKGESVTPADPLALTPATD